MAQCLITTSLSVCLALFNMARVFLISLLFLEEQFRILIVLGTVPYTYCSWNSLGIPVHPEFPFFVLDIRLLRPAET